MPWIVLVGPRCAWHLAPAPDRRSFFKEALALSGGMEVLPGWVFAGEMVPVFAVPHEGRARLPDGDRIAALEVRGQARLRRKGKATFLVVPTLETRRLQEPGIPESDVQLSFLGTFGHELVHTRHLVAVAQAAARITKGYGIPPDADIRVVQRNLHKKKGYTRACEAERDLLFRAAVEPDLARAGELAADALRLAEQRRTRWLRGRRVWLRELESLVLSVEGVAEWFRYRLLADDPAEQRSDTEILAFVRGKNRGWRYEEGLALFVVIDRLAPGWQSGFLDGEPRSPFVLLAEAINVQRGRIRPSPP